MEGRFPLWSGKRTRDQRMKKSASHRKKSIGKSARRRVKRRLAEKPEALGVDAERRTDSGIPIKEVYHHAGERIRKELGLPGEFPFTRGVHPAMHRGRL